jgi:hypothetical protein
MPEIWTEALPAELAIFAAITEVSVDNKTYYSRTAVNIDNHMIFPRLHARLTGNALLHPTSRNRRLAMIRIKLLMFAAGVILAVHELLASDGILKLPM